MLKYNEKQIPEGAFSLAMSSGAIAAGIVSGSPVWSWRWTDAAKGAAIHGLWISAGAAAVAFLAGSAIFELRVARAFTASDAGGTAATLTGNAAKLATASADTLLGDCRIASAGALTPGTRTLDANPIGCVAVGVPAAAGAELVRPATPLFVPGMDRFPLIIEKDEGLVVLATVPGAGTWTFSVRVAWQELPTV